MLWQATVALNLIIAGCYVMICFLITQGLIRTRQIRVNPLAVATATIFLTCAVHHAHHALHLVRTFGPHAHAHDLVSVRAVFGEWHTVAVELVGAMVAVTYLGLRHSYKALLNTPAMFDDAVRLAAEERLREVAFTDQLTGVPNRAAYQQYADGMTAADGDVHVLFVDLDGFKLVNDTFGHDAGDRMLREIAQRLLTGLADQGRLFRIGGDELVVIARAVDVPRDELLARAQALIAQPVSVRDGTIVISASIGATTGPALAGVDGLVREADAGMYAIKSQRPAIPAPRAAPAPEATAVSQGARR
jgi:diguanylate cyclase (GGDEF)-like protein